MTGYVLTDFRPYHLSEAVPQEKLIQLAIAMRVKAIAVKEGLTSVADIEALHKSIFDKMMHFGLKAEHIKQRRLYFAITQEHFFANNSQNLENKPHEKSLYKDLLLENINPTGASLSERMNIFDDLVTRSVFDMYAKEQQQPDDMIHVTCTGYALPSPLQRLVNAKSWNNATTITHSYHMGCYGSIPAIRMALGFLTSSNFLRPTPKKRVDIVHTELNSLHSSLIDDSAGAIIASTLFGDGFIRYSLKHESEMQAGEVGLKIYTIDERLLPNTLDSMSWTIKNHQFRIMLGVTIPDDIQNNIIGFTQKLFKNIGRDYDEHRRDDYIFAIHPGGPKITSNIAKKLNLSQDEIRYSTEVLRDNGNIVSSTVPNILCNLIKDSAIPIGQKIVTMAFGPGLAAGGAIVEKVIY